MGIWEVKESARGVKVWKDNHHLVSQFPIGSIESSLL